MVFVTGFVVFILGSIGVCARMHACMHILGCEQRDTLLCRMPCLRFLLGVVCICVCVCFSVSVSCFVHDTRVCIHPSNPSLSFFRPRSWTYSLDVLLSNIYSNEIMTFLCLYRLFFACLRDPALRALSPFALFCPFLLHGIIYAMSSPQPAQT